MKNKGRFRLRLKGKGNELYHDFIRKHSTDSVFKKQVDKAMFLNFAICKQETSIDAFYKSLGKIFPDGQIHTEWDLFNNKYKHFKNTFDETKLKKSWHIKIE